MQLDEIGRNKGRRRQADVQNLMCLSDKFCLFSQHNQLIGELVKWLISRSGNCCLLFVICFSVPFGVLLSALLTFSPSLRPTSAPYCSCRVIYFLDVPQVPNFSNPPFNQSSIPSHRDATGQEVMAWLGCL